MLSFDEKGRTPIKHFEGRKWFDNRNANGLNAIYRVATKQKVKGLLDYFAAKDIHTGRVFHAWYDWKNAFIVIDFFERLLREIPDKTIYVLIDCWSAHRAGIMKSFLDLHERLKFVFMPTKASWMNDVERYFGEVERDVLRNSNFANVGEMISALSTHPKLGTII